MAYLPGQQYVWSPSGVWIPQLGDAAGSLITREGSSTLFYEDFSGAVLDTVDLWTVVSGATPVVSGGLMTMAATLSTANVIRSQDLMPLGTGFADFRAGVQLGAIAATGAGRFWGLAVPTGAPSASSLVAEGVGFEIDQATGSLLAVTYTGSVRTTVATLTRPSDGLLHRYTVQHRVTSTTWFIDGVSTAVASVSFPSVANADHYAMVVRLNAAAFTGTPVFAIIAIAVGDTARDAVMLADRTVGARRARIRADGSVHVAGRRQVATSTAPVSTVVGTTSVSILAANIARVGGYLINSGTTTLFFRFDGVAPTVSLYSWRLDPGDRFELGEPVPSGQVFAIGSAASGTLLVTELI